MKRVYARRNGRQLVMRPQMALLVDHSHLRELNLACPPDSLNSHHHDGANLLHPCHQEWLKPLQRRLAREPTSGVP